MPFLGFGILVLRISVYLLCLKFLSTPSCAPSSSFPQLLPDPRWCQPVFSSCSFHYVQHAHHILHLANPWDLVPPGIPYVTPSLIHLHLCSKNTQHKYIQSLSHQIRILFGLLPSLAVSSLSCIQSFISACPVCNKMTGPFVVCCLECFLSGIIQVSCYVSLMCLILAPLSLVMGIRPVQVNRKPPQALRILGKILSSSRVRSSRDVQAEQFPLWIEETIFNKTFR